jgi:hypothetical protein
MTETPGFDALDWLFVVWAFLFQLVPVIRSVEDLLPDHEQSSQVIETPAEVADTAILA